MEKINNNKRLEIKKAKRHIKKNIRRILKRKDRRVRMRIKIFNIKIHILLVFE